MNYSEKVRQYTFDLIKIHKYYCKNCITSFAVAISTSDTDMVPIFLSSVYSDKSETLVIAELINSEYYYGCKESMPKRIGKFFYNEKFYYIDYHNICPICGKAFKNEQVFKIQEYIKQNPNIYISCILIKIQKMKP